MRMRYRVDEMMQLRKEMKRERERRREREKGRKTVLSKLLSLSHKLIIRTGVKVNQVVSMFETHTVRNKVHINVSID